MPTTLTSKSAAEMFVSSGGANGTRVSPLGFIESAVAPRLDYDPVTKAAKGLLIESGRTNMLRYASRFDQTAGWNVNVAGGTPLVKVVPNATLAPNGHMEAAKLILSSQSNYGNGRVTQIATKAAAIGTYVASVYLKSAGGQRAFIYVCGASATNSISANFDLLGSTHSSSKTGSFAIISTSVTDAGNGWRRYALVFTCDESTAITYALYPSGASMGAGDDINGAFAWGAQLEAGTFVTSCIPSVDTVTARASIASCYDAKGVMRYAVAGVGRVNYDPANLMLAPALLTEPQRTNLVLSSSQMNRNPWSVGITGGSAGKLAPDGTLRAIEYAGAATGPLTQGNMIATSSEMTFSVFVKNAGLTGPLSFTWRNDTTALTFTPYATVSADGNGGLTVSGTGWDLRSVGNGWYRLSNTKSTGIAVGDSLRIYTGVTGAVSDRGAFQVFGAQLEDGSVATSYIPSSDTFASRSSTGTYFDAQGKIQTAAVNAARMSYNPADLLAPPTLLQEAASTNMLTVSDFATPGGTSLLGDAAYSDFSGIGMVTGVKIGRPTVAQQWSLAYKTVTLQPNTSYCLSVFVKMDDGLVPVFRSDTAASESNDFALAIVGVTPPMTKFIVTPQGDGVYRVSCIHTTGSSVPGANVGAVKYPQNSPRGFRVTGYQLEQAAFASSYIPTAAATVLRAAEVTSSTAGTRAADTVGSAAVARSADFVYIDAAKGWLNAAEGAVALEVELPKMPDITVRNIMELGDGTAGNRLSMGMSIPGGVYCTGTVGGTTTATTSAGNAGVLSPGDYFKVALAYGAEGLRYSFRTDGLRKNAMAAMPPITRFALGAVAWGSNQACLHIKAASYFPQRLTDAEVSALTA
ncbi:hypothetical protein [Variovorax sp.]|jgi:hypothetical protein|uniref:phage head spike fiber domain-containing protein n=1 Tax=Variovorax sp. TaxID=1871043 RepID=UPI00120341FE|nr:hypothetical protein [Variovorax sp.]TAJ67980.1 MAG: hypothetical protein EPO53_01095 [Variovorax sp.]